jgi:hypothetical protein
MTLTDRNERLKPFIKLHLFSSSSLFLLTFFLLAVPMASLAQDTSLGKVVTLTEQFKVWHLEEPVKLYTPDDLFTYINGEAELYMPYGFTQLASAFYKKTGSSEIGLAVDVYKMGSLLDAFGIYAQYRKPDNQFLAIGCEGYINPSQLMFYQDRYFIHLAASGTSEFDQSVFESFARAVSKNLPSASKPPQELDLMKVKALIPRTERYFPEGLLGYRFFRHGVIALAQLDNKKVRFFVLKEESPQSSQKTITAYVQYIESSGKKIQSLDSPSGERMLFTMDPLHNGLIIGTKGQYVYGTADLDNPAQGSGLIKEIGARLP